MSDGESKKELERSDTIRIMEVEKEETGNEIPEKEKKEEMLFDGVCVVFDPTISKPMKTKLTVLFIFLFK